LYVVALLGEKWSADNKDGVLLCLSQVKFLRTLLKEFLVLRCWFMIYKFYLLFLVCRAPNPDNVLIIQTPSGAFSAKSLVQNKKKGGSRLISLIREDDEAPAENTITCDPFSAARCRVFKRKINSKKVILGLIHKKSVCFVAHLLCPVG